MCWLCVPFSLSAFCPRCRCRIFRAVKMKMLPFETCKFQRKIVSLRSAQPRSIFNFRVCFAHSVTRSVHSFSIRLLFTVVLPSLEYHCSNGLRHSDGTEQNGLFSLFSRIQSAHKVTENVIIVFGSTAKTISINSVEFGSAKHRTSYGDDLGSARPG